MHTEICERLGIEFPIFAFSHCRDVVAAVSKAGGFGVLGALAFSPAQLELELKWIDENVDGKPYGLDVVMPADYVGKESGDLAKVDLEKMIPEEHRKFLNELLDEYGVPQLPADLARNEGLLGWSESGGRALVDVGMKHPIKLIANALGPPPKDVIDLAHDAGIVVAALVGRTDQALKQKAQGVDIIIASGHEAGGHTGEITTMVLVPEVVDAVHPTPVLAAGGIGSGRQMAASLALGAQGVWMGSIWLTTSESDYGPPLIEKLLAATSSDTVRSRSLSGKPARLLKTALTDAWESKETPDPLPMPLQFLVSSESTQRIARSVNIEGSRGKELTGSPVGQIVGKMNHVQPCREVIRDMVTEYLDTVEQMAKLSERAS